MPRLTNLPCAKCATDTIHSAYTCLSCGELVAMAPVHQPTARQRMYAARAGKKGGRRRHAHGFGVPLTIGRGRG